jgi:hypothetical protein
MTDFHHNIFHYYRGAKGSDKDRERQLEDNTTKALINTLEYCDPKVAMKFLGWLRVVSTGEIKFELQKKTIGEGLISRKQQRILLAIIPSHLNHETHIEPADLQAGESRPDAWISGDDYVIIIESKVAGNLEPQQKQDHLRKLKVGTIRPRYEERTWDEVHRFFMGLLAELSGRSKWIVEQFIDYLEGIGMAEFTGFENEIFDYFFWHNDEEARKWVRDTFRSFSNMVHLELKSFDSFYEDYDVGNLHIKDEHCWVAFGPGRQKYRQWAHQTISLHAQGLEVFVNVELKGAIDKLKGKLRQNKKDFRNQILNLTVEEPFSIQVEERLNRQASIFDYRLIAKLESTYLRDDRVGSYGFEYVESILERVPLPYLTVRKGINRSRAIEFSKADQGRSLIKEVVRLLQAFHPIVAFINNPYHVC